MLNNMQIVKFKKIVENAVLPQYAHEGDAGFDLQSIEEVTIPPMEVVLVRTGLIAEIPEETEIQVRSRSGIALKQKVFVLNSPGTIDSRYRGELCVILFNLNNTSVTYEAGTKVAQGVLASVLQGKLTEDSVDLNTCRGTGGFGSTGLKN
jgi:dUTP pyrophosphatase